MGKSKPGPFSGRRIVPNKIHEQHFDTFFMVKRTSTQKETFHNVSPFLVHKAFTETLGEVPSIRKLRSGDLLVEVSNRKQSQQILKLKALATIPITVSAHATLNSSKGVITCGELFHDSVEHIAEELKSQGVTNVRRIQIRRDGQLLDTKHLVLTFHYPKLPEIIMAGYIRLHVRPYIPNPLRCFQCQKYGHSKDACRGTLTCARCAQADHESSHCTAPEKCVNCRGSHTSFSRSCPAWITEKEVVAVKVKEQVSYPEARRIVKARTPTPGTSFASAVKKTLHASSMQTELKNSDLDLLLSSIRNNPNFMKPPFVSPTIIDASNDYDKLHKTFGSAMPSVSNILVSHEPPQKLTPITPSIKNAAKTISALKTDKTSAPIASVKKKNKKKKNSDKSLKKLKSIDVKHVPPSPQSDDTLSLTTSASDISDVDMDTLSSQRVLERDLAANDSPRNSDFLKPPNIQ
ncbi:hypothetical protein AVEN_78763-1 [Araneus ventricosus]|uniref:CCHC-type domain-containing protein n=1 Tax=Araneus ventricosus TaxID=182803 RepID=A0A4Y2NNZ3_ARAVE|nr:hypothetical protein AVEN_78763-1 [Araneus ventricosus]